MNPLNTHGNPEPDPTIIPCPVMVSPFLPCQVPGPLPCSTERPTVSVTAPSTHFTPTLAPSSSHLPTLRQCCHPAGTTSNGARTCLGSCPLSEERKRKKTSSCYSPGRVMGLPLLSSDLQVAALVIGRARGSPAHTAVHCAVDWALYPRSVTVKRVRFLASRAPNPAFVPGETRSNCWLQRLTFLKLPT